jgi:hypothetical protein
LKTGFRVDETWRKLRLSIAHINKNAANFDWFVRSCDDTYFIVENLRRFLADKNPDERHFFGRSITVSLILGWEQVFLE